MSDAPNNQHSFGQPDPRAAGSMTGHSHLDRRVTDRLAARGIIMAPNLPLPTSSTSSNALYTPPSAPAASSSCACAETPTERAERERIEQARTARRVLVSFILFLLLMPVVLFVTAISEIEIPMVAIFGLFALVLVGALMTAAGNNADRPEPQSPPEDEGRPIGCCSGPRPMRRFRE